MRYTCRTLALATAIACVLCAPRAVHAQATPTPAEPDTLVNWVNSRVKELLAAKKAIAENGNGMANQKESPSTDSSSTSLVDTSAASDFVSLALNLTGLRAGEGDSSKPTSGSVTVTAYSLIAAAKGVALTDPQFYKNRTNWRRLAITIGSEESKPDADVTDKPSTNLGAKILIINDRDVSCRRARSELAGMDNAVADVVRVEQSVRNELECIIFRALDPAARRAPALVDCTKDKDDEAALLRFFLTLPFAVDHWPATLEKLEKNADAMKNVDRVIERLAVGRTMASERITAAVERIQRAQQLSIAYFTKQREQDGTDDHRAELIFDYGLTERLNWTVNASFDYRDRKLAADSKSGRVATEFQAKLTSPGSQLWSTGPVTLSGSSEASKDPDSTWLIRAQLKLVVPVTTGVSIPVAYTYASRDAEGIVSGSQLRFALSLDPVRLRERFR
jgi:hypothetical protein